MAEPLNVEGTHDDKRVNIREERNKVQDEIRARYQEYKQRQNESALGAILQWSLGERETEPNTDVSRLSYRIKEPPKAPEDSEDYARSVPRSKEGARRTSSGKKEGAQANVAGVLPSNQKFEEHKEQIHKLQSTLQNLQMEKQRLETEFAKYGNRAEKSLAMKKKKEECEFELDLVDKNIQRIKHKLRELSAFG